MQADFDGNSIGNSCFFLNVFFLQRKNWDSLVNANEFLETKNAMEIPMKKSIGLFRCFVNLIQSDIYLINSNVNSVLCDSGISVWWCTVVSLAYRMCSVVRGRPWSNCGAWKWRLLLVASGDFMVNLTNNHWLVVWNIVYFPIYWVANHPNWLSYFSEGWPNHQPDHRIVHW